jgi:adenylate kinase family enzyme
MLWSNGSPAGAPCKDCGRGYHVKFDPPRVVGVCDACGGELFQRDDDSEETIRKSLEVYHGADIAVGSLL